MGSKQPNGHTSKLELELVTAEDGIEVGESHNIEVYRHSGYHLLIDHGS